MPATYSKELMKSPTDIEERGSMEQMLFLGSGSQWTHVLHCVPRKLTLGLDKIEVHTVYWFSLLDNPWKHWWEAEGAREEQIAIKRVLVR